MCSMPAVDSPAHASMMQRSDPTIGRRRESGTRPQRSQARGVGSAHQGIPSWSQAGLVATIPFMSVATVIEAPLNLEPVSPDSFIADLEPRSPDAQARLAGSCSAPRSRPGGGSTTNPSASYSPRSPSRSSGSRPPTWRRALGGCDHPDCVVPLCWMRHRAYDTGRLELLPHLEPRWRTEIAHAVTHRALTGGRAAADPWRS